MTKALPARLEKLEASTTREEVRIYIVDANGNPHRPITANGGNIVLLPQKVPNR